MAEHDPLTVNAPQAPCYASLKGKTALVTGGGSGIGRAICVRLAMEGTRVLFCGRTAETLEQTLSMVKAVGGSGSIRVADLSSNEECEALMQWSLAEAGALDVLVLNAADMRNKRWRHLDREKWDYTLATNAGSSFTLAKLAAEHMSERNSGSIIFVSTIGAVRAHHNMWAYDASKGAIECLSRAMAVTLAPLGVRVNSLAPGATTPVSDAEAAGDVELMMKQSGLGTGPARAQEQEFVPMRRWATPAEIAAVAAFLASDQASYITGHTLVVDGGALAQISPVQARI